MKRKITKGNPLGMYKRMPVALFAMAFAAGGGLNAQTWTGEALPSLSGEYYLYNKGEGKFLLGANSWGTQASLDAPGLLCNVAVSNGKYSIQTFVGSAPNNYLGANGFVDAPMAEFDLVDTDPNDGLNEFTIGSGGKYLRLSSGTALAFDGTDASESSAQWLLVSKEQRVKALDEATADNGVDASFYIVRPNFSRSHPGTPWTETHEGGSVSLYGPEQGASSNNFCVEANANSNFDVFQTVTGLKNGRYVLSCQGFYRAGAVGSEEGNQNAYLYANGNLNPLQLLKGDDAPTDYKAAAAAFNEGKFTGNQVEVIVTNGTLKFGVRKSESIASDWACFDSFRLTYYGEVSEVEVFEASISELLNLKDRFASIGATKVVAQLDELYVQYKDSKDYAVAAAAISDMTAVADAVYNAALGLSTSLSTAKAVLQKVEDGTYALSDNAKSQFTEKVNAAQKTLDTATIEDMGEAAVQGAANVDAAVSEAMAFIGLSYPLSTAKVLADRIGGLSATEEYKKVEADLNSSGLTYDDVILDVAALNALCKEKMTEEFLGTASADNPIDMTSFIVNPNIYQNGESTEVPGGWIIADWGSADNHNPTTDSHTDTDLFCYSWSCNAANNVAKGHYYQKIGGKEEGAVNLPDGLYELSAATYINGDDKRVMLYATSDSVNFTTEWFNTDRTVYDAARDDMATTTLVQNVIVSGGQLYIGIKGEGIVGGTGKSWNADNFRLSYVGADALSAYRERLQGRLDEGEVLHDSLMTYGIDDSEYYGWALDPEDGYYAFLEEGGVDEITEAIDQLDEMNTGAKQVITNYLAFNPLVVSGNNLMDQLNNGQLYAQPTAKETFMTALEAAATIAENMTWDNYLSEDIATQTEALKAATTTLMNSVALCYSMGTAKELADQIGGLTEEQAYKDVVTYLGLDELDPIDVDLAVKALQEVCINAMTPEVLAKASVENPLNMTTFVVNPNIYQDAVDDEGTPVNTKVNGWICESSADDGSRTAATSGDTWLYCYSWSGHSTINIAANTNYRQVVGTQINEEGKFALPTGAYRVEAATYATSGAGALELYALTNEVETSVVPDINGQDSIVYTYTELESADSTFNGDKDMWDAAQASLATTTVIPEIYVDKGAVTIGVRGNGGVVGGNGHSWIADNFRFYYIGQERGSDIQGTMANAENLASEIVDVYDIMGKLVRKQVKRADAVKGLKRGIYIAGGKKYVVTGK